MFKKIIEFFQHDNIFASSVNIIIQSYLDNKIINKHNFSSLTKIIVKKEFTILILENQYYEYLNKRNNINDISSTYYAFYILNNDVIDIKKVIKKEVFEIENSNEFIY